MIEEFVGVSFGLCGSHGPIVAEKVIDISALCTNVEDRAIIMYATDPELGPIVNLLDCREKTGDISGESVHYYYWNFGLSGLSKLSNFIKWSKNWGIDPEKLASLIFSNRNAP
ncbi:MAG: hypothetical protein ABIG10_02575 [bacterium]